MRMKENDFNEIYKRNYRRSFLFVKSYVHDDMAAEDIVAESLVKYWRAVSSGNNKPVNESLLLTMLRNRALDFLRHQAVHEAAVGEMANLNDRELSIRISTLAACDPEEIFSKEIQAIIHEALRSLPEQTRRVFIMSRFENKTVKEIAEETGLTVKGVEYHITKTLKIFSYLKGDKGSALGIYPKQNCFLFNYPSIQVVIICPYHKLIELRLG